MQAIGVLLAMAMAGAGLAGAAERDAARSKKDLKQALAQKDPAAVDAAVAVLAQAGGRSSMRSLLDFLEKMPATEDALYWSLLSGVISFVDREALDELGDFLKRSKSRPIARDILVGFAKNGSAHAVLAAKPLLLDAPMDIRLLAAAKVSRIKSRDAVDALIELLKAEEKVNPDKPTELAWIAIEGLNLSTGQNYGHNSVNWEGWWAKNRDKPLTGGTGHQGGGSTAVDFLKMSPDVKRKEAFIGVEKAPEKAVVVLSGEYTKKHQRDYNKDHMEQVLQSMGIPHTVVRREDFPGYDLSGVGALLINCTQYLKHCICPTCVPSGEVNNRLYKCSGCGKHIEFKAELTGEDIKKITSFVQKGGYLFCEDWAVREVIERAFPKYIVTSTKLKEGTADVLPSRGMGTHPYLRGIFQPKVIEAPHFAEIESPEDGEGEKKKPTTVVVKPPPDPDAPGEEAQKPEPLSVKHIWQIDDESYAFKIMDAQAVVPLLASGTLQKIAGGNGTVAAAFRPGSPIPPAQPGARGAPGVVMAVLSHFGDQSSLEDEVSIQNLLLNFLIDANAAREERTPRTKAQKKIAEPEKEKPADPPAGADPGAAGR
jgi:hypothetical protein